MPFLFNIIIILIIFSKCVCAHIKMSINMNVLYKPHQKHWAHQGPPKGN